MYSPCPPAGDRSPTSRYYCTAVVATNLSRTIRRGGKTRVARDSVAHCSSKTRGALDDCRTYNNNNNRGNNNYVNDALRRGNYNNRNEYNNETETMIIFTKDRQETKLDGLNAYVKTAYSHIYILCAQCVYICRSYAIYHIIIIIIYSTAGCTAPVRRRGNKNNRAQ